MVDIFAAAARSRTLDRRARRQGAASCLHSANLAQLFFHEWQFGRRRRRLPVSERVHAISERKLLAQKMEIFSDIFFLCFEYFQTNSSSQLPVIVFVHGGAYFCGNSGSFGPQYFMDHPVVVVTIQYRLNIFGMASVSLPPLTIEAC